ncbi:cadherin-related family member 5 [Labeo rohita]|uniref:Cadherin-related family member 5 n=1 Tax=Labeo rohita TaxID=84645 RepID=A0A498LRL8_LABRO|nr:cadherin-related family member 5 [Labeo rohita]
MASDSCKDECRRDDLLCVKGLLSCSAEIWLMAPLQLLCAAAMPTLTEIGFGSAGAVIRQQEGIMGTKSLGIKTRRETLDDCRSTTRTSNRGYLGDEDSISTTDIFSPRKMLFPRDDADTLFENREGRSGLQTRQLGDIEFTNRYAELLKSKAKITSICAFLKRMESSKKSGVGGETDRLIFLMRQYSCPNVYQ